MPDLIASLSPDDSILVGLIVLSRLIVPLFIPRLPLLIVVALVLDGIDNSLLAQFTSVDLSPDGPYQSWDKALDIYYLSIAYLSTMRNWTSKPAIKVARFLFYYRLAGVVLFELLDSRAMLLIFPNTFEFFFIAYELIRLRYAPAKLSTRFWVGLAAGLWVCVKLPQEYWIHIAQRDFTDTVSDNPVIGVAAALLIGALLAVLRWVVQPRLRAPDHDGLRLRADEATVVTERSSASGIPSMLEKIVLLALLCTIFAEILPRVDWSPLQVTVGIIVVVCANAAIGVRTAWGARLGVDSTAARVTALLAANLALVLATRIILLPGLQSVQLRAALFFALLITVIIGLYDTYRPVFERRFAG